MTVKQKVNYSVSYDSSTDTLSTQLNILLDRIITLIRTNNPELLELTRVTYGSAQMTGAPMYDSGSTKYYQSDVVFLGTDADNIVLSLCFYSGRLVIAMNIDPSVEALYVTNWSTLTNNANTNNLPYCTARASKFYTNNTQNAYSINIPYLIVNKTIEFDVVYWTGDYSSGYMFYNANKVTNGVDLVIFKTLENLSGTTSVGGALWKYSTATDSYNNVAPSCLVTWSFEENVANNMPDKIYGGSNISGANDLPYAASSVYANGKYDMRQWFKMGSNTGNGMAYLHTLGALRGLNPFTAESMPVIDTVSSTSPTDANFVSPLMTAYNIPYLSSDEAYLRRVRIPGFNKYCKGEIYLFYTPTTTQYDSGDIIDVDGKQFAVINNGIVCWVARVS